MLGWEAGKVGGGVVPGHRGRTGPGPLARRGRSRSRNRSQTPRNRTTAQCEELAMQKRRPVMLVVLDGWGWREEVADNAIRQAKTPDLRPAVGHRPARVPAHLRPRRRPAARADGQFRGRPSQHRRRPRGDAGPAAHQRRHRSGEIKTAPALTGLIDALKQSGGTCHLIGLVSPGGVHSHQDHAVALAKILTDAGVPTVVHALTDGRDTPPQSAGRGLDAAHRRAAAVGPGRDRDRALLRDGSRQALGARGQGLQRDRRGGRPALRRRAGGDRRRLCAQAVSTSSSCRR